MSRLRRAGRTLLEVLVAGLFCYVAVSHGESTEPTSQTGIVPSPTTRKDSAAEEKQHSNKTQTHSIADLLEEALEKEFRDESEKEKKTSSQGYNASAMSKGASIESVVKISSSHKVKPTELTTEPASASGGVPVVVPTAPQKYTQKLADDLEVDSHDPDEGQEDWEAGAGEADVDRIIDADNNEYVLSRPRTGLSLVLDPLLIQDLTILITSSSAAGCMFELVQQPVINGYLLAGSVVGPGGLKLVKELVQVQSLAQLGVQLLLFGLGLEFSFYKLRAVRNVAIIGGMCQILAFIVTTALLAVMIGASVYEGVFVGALVSMSSTSVVVKCLGDCQAQWTQITIGTLILQDCTVGLMFALMPVLGSLSRGGAGSPDRLAAIVLLVLKVLLKLGGVLLLSALLTQTLLPRTIRFFHRFASHELFQLIVVSFCLLCAWACGWMGLSQELGAFLAGMMLSASEEQEHVLHCTEQVRNIFTGLFIASIGLIMSPEFLIQHMRVLSISTLMLVLAKTVVISTIVWLFDYSISTALLVGASLSQVGEFAFVLLSLASQQGLLHQQLYMLLLGVTALSLLITPLVLTIFQVTIKALSSRSGSSMMRDGIAPSSQKEAALQGLGQGSALKGGAGSGSLLLSPLSGMSDELPRPGSGVSFHPSQAYHLHRSAAGSGAAAAGDSPAPPESPCHVLITTMTEHRAGPALPGDAVRRAAGRGPSNRL